MTNNNDVGVRIGVKMMEQIITSLLDSDLYKFSMQQAVLELFPTANVEYRFKNRGKQRFTPEFLKELENQIVQMAFIALSHTECSWIKENIPFFKPAYSEYLRNYRFNPDEVRVNLDRNNDLVLDIKGPWHTTILWEVPLMALISELYFKMIDTKWDPNYDDVYKKAHAKHTKMRNGNVIFADFGTRRRRSYNVQSEVVKAFMFYKGFANPGFVGTSNVHFAMEYGTKPVGTMAHEFIQAMAALESFNHANYYALQNWVKVYNADLGIALTDTFGTDAFFQNFNMRLAKLYDGVRHDSGDPIEFGEKVIAHYKKFGIDPMSKTIIFSDGLDVDEALRIQLYFDGITDLGEGRRSYGVKKIKVAFGIGTHFTNDFESSPALNMVIKLWSCNEVPVVKLSDTPGKEIGDPDAVRVMKWIYRNQALDRE